MRERDIEKALIRRVKELGGEVRKVTWQGRKGAPDRLVLLPYPYCAIWVELKAPNEKPTKLQQREHNKLRVAGLHVVVIDSIEAIEDLLG